MADVADAETIGFRYIAGVNDEALVVEAIIEIVEVKIVYWIEKRRDDVSLYFLGHVFHETHCTHAGHTDVMVSAITGGAAKDAAFSF